MSGVTIGTFIRGFVAYDSSRQLPVTVCPAFPTSWNGTSFGCSGNGMDYHYDTVCRFWCKSGYIGSGSQVRRCQHNGTWSGQDFTCQTVTCPTLPPPTNGELLGCNTTEMLHDTVCRFSCKEGSEASGSTVRRCTENGTWSGNDLVCTGITNSFSSQLHVPGHESKPDSIRGLW
ncbi:hypothetical protein ACROYT_G033954 [Oculina patagonica]